MKKTLLFAIGLVTIVSLSVKSAPGQTSTPAPDREEIERSSIRSLPPVQMATPQGPEAKAQTFFWVESEFGFDGKLVNSSPYSAQAVTEATQLLTHRTRIVRNSSNTPYPDSEGR